MKNINALGDACPIPVIKAKNALKEMAENDTLVISVDNIIATENLAKMAKEMGFESSLQTINDTHFDVTIIKGSSNTESKVSHETGFIPSAENSVVVIASNQMGSGDEELGKTLLKGFIYALTELENPPKTMLFYNSGAYITTEGSQSLDDLKILQDKGVEILTCGACLNFYGLGEKLAAGSVTNMYSIVEKLNDAAKIIKP